MAEEYTTLELVYDSLYTARYKVSGGPMDSRIVQIIYGLPDLLRSQRDNWVRIYNFENDVIKGINILNYQGTAVTEDVLNAYNSDLSLDTRAQTGAWIPGQGWTIVNPPESAEHIPV